MPTSPRGTNPPEGDLTPAGGSEFLVLERLLDRLALAPGMRVADFGCGATGAFAIPIARRVGPSGRVYAIDILKHALRGMESNARLLGLAHIIPMWSDVEVVGALSIPPGSLDVVLIANVLFQSRKRAQILREAKRLLKRPTGKLAVIDWLLPQIAATGNAARLGPPHEYRVHPQEVTAIASSLGLVREKDFDPGPHHFGLVFGFSA